MVSVVGVAGVGKSRLRWEFDKYVDGLLDFVRYHTGRCLSYGDGVAYWALAEMLRQRFQLTANDMFDLTEEVDYTILFELLGLPLPALLDVPWVPLPPHGFQEGTAAMFAAIHAEDLLVHHPYDSFDASVEHFISAAADEASLNSATGPGAPWRTVRPTGSGRLRRDPW